MNAACAGIKGDMVAFEDIDSAVINGQRMMEGCEVPFSAEHFAAYEFVVFNLAVSHGSRSEFLAHEVVFISGFVVYPYIGEFRVHADVEDAGMVHGVVVQITAKSLMDRRRPAQGP